MQKVFILGLIVILTAILSFNAAALVDLNIDDIKCIGLAGVEFKILNKGNEEAYAKDITVKSNFFSAFSLKVDERGADKNYKFNINGTFTSDKIYPVEDQLEPVKFISENNLLTYPGTYKIYLDYKGCKESYGKCEDISQVICAGLQEYGCNLIPIKIDSCENTESEVLVKFHNVKKGLLMSVDPLKDLDYIFFGKKYHIENDLPDDITVKEIADDLFLLKFKQIPGNSIDRIKIFSKVCGEADYSNCKFVGSNKTSNETRSIMSPLNGSINQSLMKEKEGSSDSIIYIISLIFVVILLFIIYNIKKVKI